MHRGRAFSLIEMVLVLVILGIVAAIAAPRLSGAASRTRDAAMAASQDELQRAVELFTAEHADRGPVIEPDGSVSPDPAALVGRLTGRTDDTGSPAPAGAFGPYLRAWPVNLYNGRATVRIDGPAPGANTHGWRIDSQTLAIAPDHAAILAGGGAAAVGPAAGAPADEGP